MRKGFSLRTFSGEFGRETVGKYHFAISNFKDARGAVLLAPTGLSRKTITHEFGHTLGLKHEQIHPDAQTANSICPYYANNDDEFHEGLIYTDFDESSVMNYCYIHSPSGFNAGLSEKDQELILNLFYDKYPFERGRTYNPRSQNN